MEVFRQTVASNVLVGSYCALTNQVSLVWVHGDIVVQYGAGGAGKGINQEGFGPASNAVELEEKRPERAKTRETRSTAIEVVRQVWKCRSLRRGRR